MRETLMFVRGGVADKEGPAPVLTRFCITGGRIQGSNGRLALDAPCPELEGIDVLVPADKFIAAVDACDLEPRIDVTESGRLSIKHKHFRALLPVQEVTAFPMATPTPGKPVSLQPNLLLPVLKALRPFIGEDHTRAWCMTVIGDGKHAYATNSNMIARYPSKLKLQLPVYLIDELLRMGVEPDTMAFDGNSSTFFYGSSWLRAQLINETWPIDKAQEHLSWKDNLPQLPEGLVGAIESLLPFCPNPKLPVIHFTKKGVSTEPGDTQAEITGDTEWPEVAFDSRNLIPLLRAADSFAIDPETGKGVVSHASGFRGVIAGRKYAA